MQPSRVLSRLSALPLPGLKLSAIEWLPALESASEAPYVLLVHGYMDAGATWDLLAPDLAAAGFHVVALDLRGYGDSEHIGRKGYYHFPDYVLDVAEFLDATGAPDRISVVGHSMGGVVSTLYAGARPERVASLVLVEGLGPPDSPPGVSPERMGEFLRTVQKARGETEKAMTLEEAFQRLRRNHSTIDEAIVRTRLPHLLRRVGDGDAYMWKRDPLHRTRSPIPFSARTFGEFAQAITAPVLWVDGGASGYHPPDEEERLAQFRSLRRFSLEGAGHMIHWTRPNELGALVLDHLKASL
ncbi:MAG: alpha/beta hydrolase [Polyangiaceae bacterium]